MQYVLGRGRRRAWATTPTSPGVLAALDELEAPPGAWLVLGTGGGARAAVGAARERGASVAIASAIGRSAAAVRGVGGLAGRQRGGRRPSCAVVINTTPLGLAARRSAPARVGRPRAAAVALDMVYAGGDTPWVRAMRSAGLRAADGRAMLVAQGAAALERWFPGKHAPVEVMRAAVDARLR